MKTRFSILLFLIFALLPNVFYNQLIEPENTLKVAIFSSCLLLSLIYFFLQKNEKQAFKISAPMVLLFCFIFIKGVGIFFSYNKAEAVFDVLEWLLVLVVAILLLNTTNDKSFFVLRISQMAVVATVLFALWGLVSALPFIQIAIQKHQPVVVNYKITSSLGNKNFYAQVCFLLIPFLLIGFSSTNRKWKIIFLLAVLINVCSIIVLKSFAVMIATALSFGMAGFIFFYKKNKKLLLVFASLTIIAGIIFLKFSNSSSFINRRINEIKNINANYSESSSATERWLLWNNTFQMIKENPMGVGTCNWVIYYQKYAPECLPINSYGETKNRRPHNDFLFVVAENGWLGLLVFISIFIASCLSIFYSSLSNWVKYALLMFFTGFCIFCFFDFPTQRFYILLLLAIGIAITATFLTDKKNIFTYQFPIPYKLFFTVVISISLITSVVSWARVQGEFMMYKTIYSRLAADWWQMNESSKAALAVGYTHDPVGQPLNWYCGTALLNSNRIMEAKKYFVASLKQNPYHFETWNDLGSCYERLNNIDSARICFKRNLQFAPKYPRSLFNLGVLFYQEKKYDSALIYMQQYPFGYTSNNYLELKKALTDSLQKRKIKN